MVNCPDGPRTGSAAAISLIARWPTGAKLLLILSIALLPLALIAIFATLQTTRTADSESRSGLRLAAAESSRALAVELMGDITALRATVDALASDEGDLPSCAHLQGVFAQQNASGVRFAIFGQRGRLLCGTGDHGTGEIARTLKRQAPKPGSVTAALIPGHGLVLATVSARHGVSGAALFPADFLAGLSRPRGFLRAYQSAILLGKDRLALADLPRHFPLERRAANRTDLGIAGLVLEMQVRSTRITSSLVVALLLPLLMWAAAAGISWFVVDRLLVRPLRHLRAGMAMLTPGEEPDLAMLRSLPAQEIRELGDTYRALTRTVALHEAGLAEGLVRQTRLTREVHHRVKNNLQVISSLINLHARSAPTPEATAAYASIQRRVDALAVVHRNHFADMEENRGLGLRAVIGELASNIRATAAEGSKPAIALDIDPCFVNQDVAVPIAFLVTETIELALAGDPSATIFLSLKHTPGDERATMNVSSPALVESDALRAMIAHRYGRVMEGLSRQLRAPLHYAPLDGRYEISVPVIGGR